MKKQRAVTFEVIYSLLLVALCLSALVIDSLIVCHCRHMKKGTCYFIGGSGRKTGCKIPMMIGGVTGSLAALCMKKICSAKSCAVVVFGGVLFTASLILLANRYLMPVPVLNFMLSGMVFSAVFANIVQEDKITRTMQYCTPAVNACQK